MKIKTFVILGSLFASLGFFSATTVLAQGKIVNYQGKQYLVLPKSEELGPSVRCSRDGESCYSLGIVDCNETACIYGLSLITTRTIFHNPIHADACWRVGSTYEYILATSGVDCRIYGVSNRVIQEKMRQGEDTKRRLDDAYRRLRELSN
ncbi:hypothetical protein QUB36_18250 [Microcoleus sp. AT8-B1]|uniref:hypothetical protein n=1 Tax=unclassified Microcoleus TaxID=2642155 RepID=UPI002FD69440